MNIPFSLRRLLRKILVARRRAVASYISPLSVDLSKVAVRGPLPFVSIHVAVYNEKKVVERLIRACTVQSWLTADSSKQSAVSGKRLANYEVILADDSNDDTTEIIKTLISADGRQLIRADYDDEHEVFVSTKPGEPTVKLIHRNSRAGFKGAALQRALEETKAECQYIVVLDADFVPYPDTIEQFVKTFQVLTAGSGEQVVGSSSRNQSTNYPLQTTNLSNIAAVQGYQWHVLNKSQNWVTRGVRTEYAGSYVIERSTEELYGGLKQISGSVYCIRADILRQFGWGISITEDFELTLRLYEAGYKVVFTPYIQVPAEAVSTIKRLIRQRMRWAEGSSFNVKVMFGRMLASPNMTRAEKLEFTYFAFYYLQAAFFVVGTLAWFISETVFGARLPFWTAAFGWSLVFTNLFALPLMNIVGMFLEESDERDYVGILSFIALSYIVVPFQAYAAIKGFLEKEEGPWFRTPKTGVVTDVVKRIGFLHFSRPSFGQAAASKPSGSEAASIAKSSFNPFVQQLAAIPVGTARGVARKSPYLAKLVVVVLLIGAISINYFALFVPTTTAAAPDPTIEQQINIIDQEVSTTSTTATPTDNSLGLVNFDSSKYAGDSVFFDAVVKCDTCVAGGSSGEDDIVNANTARATRFNQRQIIKNPRGQKAWYAFIQIGDGNADTDCLDAGEGLRVYSSADGETWTDEGQLTTSGDIAGADCMLTADVFGYDDGSQFIMYVAYAGGSDPGGDGDQRDNVQGYYEYLTVADGAATVAGEGTPDIAAAALIKANYVCINRDRQGYIWIGYYDKNEAPDDYAIVGTTTTNPTGDPAWGTRTILTDLARDIGTGDGAGDQGSCEFVNFSSGNLGGMFLVGKDTTGVDYLYGINIEGYNGSTFDVTEGVETPTLITIKTGVNDSTDWPFEAVVDSTDTAHILYQITSTGTSTVSKKASSAGTVEAWGSEITVDSNTPDTVTLSINWATSPDTLYAFYHYGTSTVRYRTTPVDTIAWSGESTLTEADNFDFMTASRRDEDGFISIMYTNAASAFTVTMQRIGLSGGNANVDVMLYDDAGELESTVSSAASTYTRVRSGALTLGADDYTARLKLDAGSGTAYVKAARLVIVQTNATNITDTQTQIEMGDNQNVTTTSDTQLTGKKTYLYDTSKFSGTETHYFEASLDSAGSTIGLEQQINIVDQQFTTGATSTGIVRIDETKYNGETYYFEVVAKVTSGSGTAVLTYDAGTGSTPSGGSTVTISSITATTFTRYRSAAFSPSSTQNAYVSSLTGTGTTVNAARIIIVQVSTSTITDSQTVVEVGSSQTTTNTSYTQLTDKKIYGYDADVFSPAPTAYFEASLQSGTAPTTTGPSNPGTTGNATNG